MVGDHMTTGMTMQYNAVHILLYTSTVTIVAGTYTTTPQHRQQLRFWLHLSSDRLLS